MLANKINDLESGMVSAGFFQFSKEVNNGH